MSESHLALIDLGKAVVGRGHGKGNGPAMGKNLYEEEAGSSLRLEQVNSGDRGGAEPQVR